MPLSPLNGATPAHTDTARSPTTDALLQARPQASTKPEPISTPASEAQPKDSEVEKALATLNDFTARVAQDVRFSVDEESGKTVVKVVDSSTQEVLRQFPSAEALSIAHSIDKMQGLLIRDKA